MKNAEDWFSMAPRYRTKETLHNWFTKGMANGYRMGAEFGFKAAEKGWNLEETLIAAEKVITDSHNHVAHYEEDGSLSRDCDLCGEDLTHPNHKRAGSQ
jgi:hypothetical protein